MYIMVKSPPASFTFQIDVPFFDFFACDQDDTQRQKQKATEPHHINCCSFLLLQRAASSVRGQSVCDKLWISAALSFYTVLYQSIPFSKLQPLCSSQTMASLSRKLSISLNIRFWIKRGQFRGETDNSDRINNLLFTFSYKAVGL